MRGKGIMTRREWLNGRKRRTETLWLAIAAIAAWAFVFGYETGRRHAAGEIARVERPAASWGGAR